MALKTVRHGTDTPGPMVAAADGGGGARYAAALCVMYWLLLTYPITLVIASVATILVTALIYLKALLRRRDSLARLTCRDSGLSHYVTLHCHAFRRALQLPVWFRNRHAQSLLGLWANEPGVQFNRTYLQMADRGLLALDWEVGGEHLPHGCPVLLVLPDLPQSALQLGALCREAFNYGMKAVVVNRRGQGGSPLSTPKLPGYGETGDLREVVDFLREGSEGVSISAVGVGTGADLLLSYLGQFGSSAYLGSAVCISPSYAGQSTLHDDLPFPYSCLYLSHLKRAVLSHAKVFGDVARLARSAWTLKEFDRRLHCQPSELLEEEVEEGGGRGGGDEGSSTSTTTSTSNSGGHATLEEFWAENEPLREVDEISVPVLCVSSLDDPVCSPRHIQHDLFRVMPNFFLLTLPQGGHAGFRQSLQGLSWAENAAMDFVLSMMTFHAQDAYVNASCAHAFTQTEEEEGKEGGEEECVEYQCRAEDGVLEVDCRVGEDEVGYVKCGQQEEVFHSRCVFHEGCAGDGERCAQGGCLDVQCLATDVEIDKQMRTPTEAHG